MLAEILANDPNNEFALSEVKRMGRIIDQHEEKIEEITAMLGRLTHMEA
jgi:hypothetical protein